MTIDDLLDVHVRPLLAAVSQSALFPTVVETESGTELLRRVELCRAAIAQLEEQETSAQMAERLGYKPIAKAPPWPTPRVELPDEGT